MVNIIVGNSVYAHMLCRYINMTNEDGVDMFVVDQQYIKSSHIGDIPVISFEEMYGEYLPSECNLYLGIGYSNMGNIRKSIFNKCVEKGYHFKNYIHPSAVIADNVLIGSGNVILENVVLEESCVLGDANLLYGGVVIGHESIVGNYCTFSISSATAGLVKVGDNCFFGVNSCARDSIEVGHHSLIGASAYAFRSLESYSLVKSARMDVVVDETVVLNSI